MRAVGCGLGSGGGVGPRVSVAMQANVVSTADQGTAFRRMNMTVDHRMNMTVDHATGTLETKEVLEKMFPLPSGSFGPSLGCLFGEARAAFIDEMCTTFSQLSGTVGPALAKRAMGDAHFPLEAYNSLVLKFRVFA